MKEKLLYLCHRIPFPANKGDKITTCNTLKFLSEYYDIYLACFIDDPFDHQYQEDVARFCKETYFVPLNKTQAKLRAAIHLFSSTPLTLPYYFNAQLQKWVHHTLESQSITKAFVYSGCMAQYILNTDYHQLHSVIQLADIDSDKWHQYAEKTSGMLHWIYKREHRTLEAYEKYIAAQFSITCFISDAETHLFRSMVTDTLKSRIQTLGNGIDCDYFSPTSTGGQSENNILAQENYVVFTGAMDYWANVDAVTWYAEKVWPAVKKARPESQFFIVGTSPTKEVLNLQSIPGIVVTGRVDDVRPYLLNAKAAVATMQIARGIQNKILEAMAMAKPIITTTKGIEGIEDYPQNHVYVSDAVETITQWTIEHLSNPTQTASESRQWLIDTYSWHAKLTPLLTYLGNDNA